MLIQIDCFSVVMGHIGQEAPMRASQPICVLTVLVATESRAKSWPTKYSKTLCETANLKKTEIGFQDQLLLNAGQKYCRMLQGAFCKTFDLH